MNKEKEAYSKIQAAHGSVGGTVTFKRHGSAHMRKISLMAKRKRARNKKVEITKKK